MSEAVEKAKQAVSNLTTPKDRMNFEVWYKTTFQVKIKEKARRPNH